MQWSEMMHYRERLAAAGLVWVGLLVMQPAAAIGADVEHGRRLSMRNCAGCHAVLFEQDSPNLQAPAFRDLGERIPVDTIDEMLLVKLSPRHTDMPTFSITPKQAGDIAAYIASVQPVAHGRALLEENCASCHSIERTGPSPRPDAPPFRSLSQNYPVSALEEALVEGIVTGHSDMPEFSGNPRQASDMIAYLESIQER